MFLKSTVLAAAVAFAGTAMFAAMPSLAHSNKDNRQIEREASIVLIRDDARALRRERRLRRRLDLAGRRDFRRRSRRLRRITASAKVRGFGPRFVQRQRARRKAIAKWRLKVADRFGFRFSRWFAARGKDVNCFNRRLGVRCVVSARPASPFRRFGFRGI